MDAARCGRTPLLAGSWPWCWPLLQRFYQGSLKVSRTLYHGFEHLHIPPDRGFAGAGMATKKVLDDGGDVLRTLSRYMQLIGVPIALALMFWQASTIWTLSLSMAKIETKVDALDGDRYSKSDAMKDFQNIYDRVTAVENADKIRTDGIQEQIRSNLAQLLQLKTKVDAIH